MDAGQLHDAVSLVCPIVGIAIGNSADKSTWRITPTADATDAQKTAAQAVIDGWDGSAATDAKRAAQRLIAGTSPADYRFRALARLLYQNVPALRNAFPTPAAYRQAIAAAIAAETDPNS